MKLAETKPRTVPSSRREEILAAIAKEEARLAKLEADQAAARGRLGALRAELATLGAMGCYLITETMSWRHQLSMESYDRLFPSQDTMPRSGFGNLIALSLQHEPRKDGNSFILDENLQPHADDQQWAYLASMPRIDPATVETIAREATRQGSVIGVRMAEVANDEDATPWVRLPSRKPRPLVVTEPLPPKRPRSTPTASRSRSWAGSRCSTKTWRCPLTRWSSASRSPSSASTWTTASRSSRSAGEVATTRSAGSSLRVPASLQHDVERIFKLTDPFCAERLDAEYGELVRKLIAKLARKRPSPLARGDLRIWAAAAIYAVGSVNFLFDRTQRPHLTGDDLSELTGVPKSTLANKAKLIRDVLRIGQMEPEFCRQELLASNPMVWMISVDGFIVDARTMPPGVQAEARRRGLIPDLPRPMGKDGGEQR